MSSLKSSSQYRPEIDGLRAIAVLSVIVFHAGVDVLQGGFVGVDVFYVISGFLITRIVADSLGAGTFSFGAFYARRIKRLFPAASLVLVCTLVAGWFILTPFEYVQLGRSAVASTLFIANAWFMLHSGYFDQSSEVSPLVHMWSLAVEEQFYLIFPAFFFVVYRLFGRGSLRPALAALSVVTLALSISLSTRYPDFSFYMLPTRAWELGLGGLLALTPSLSTMKRPASVALEISAILLLGYGMFGFGHHSVYPGYLALFPVLGTTAAIAATFHESSVLKRLLSISPLVRVGRFSYSAYLWHWPLIVFYRIYIGSRRFEPLEIGVLIVLSLASGYLSWRYVEETFRHARAGTARVFGVFVIGTCALLAAGSLAHFTHGFADRLPAEVRPIAAADEMWSFECVEEIAPFAERDEEFCVIGVPWDGASTRGLVWGDSHSLHWAQVLDQVARSRGISLLIAPTKCPPYLIADYVRSHYIKFPRFTEDCTARNELALGWLDLQPDVDLVIMASAWSGHVRMLYDDEHPGNRINLPIKDRSSAIGADLSEEALRRVLSRIDLTARRVLLLGDVARPNRELNKCAVIEQMGLLRQPCMAPYSELDATTVRAWHADSDAVLAKLAGDIDRVDAILPVEAQCGAEICSTYVDGEMIYRDSNHIRRNLKVGTIDALADLLSLQHWFDEVIAR